MYSSDLTAIKACKAVIGSCIVPRAFDPVYASFSSNITQSVGTVNPVALTYSQKDIGNIDAAAAYPTSKILIPNTGVYIKSFFLLNVIVLQGLIILKYFLL